MLRGVAIGAGYFSRFQYEAWRRMPGARIEAICNRSEARAQEIMRDFGVQRYYGWNEMERMVEAIRPDFVDIITPPPTHRELCRFFAERGVAVICQKPLGVDFDDAKAIVADMSAAGVPFMVHENWRWQPWYRKIKALLADGTLGDLHSIGFMMRVGDGWGEDAYLDRQPYFRDYPRLFVFETGVHFLDTFRFLGGDISSIYARLQRRNPVIKGEDAAQIVCGFASGATALLDANRYNESECDEPRYTFGKLRVDGSNGHVRLDMEGRLFFKPLGEPVRRLDFEPTREGFAGDCVFATQKHFVEQMNGARHFETSGEEYLKTLALVDACYDSNASGQAVTL